MRLEAFKEGSEFPACQPGLMRIYSMRFCPYAERALLVANFKDIPHEVVNINLKQKPSWFLEKYPEGKVPLLELDEKLVGESLVVAQFLDEAYPGVSLTSNDLYQRARDRMLVCKFDMFEKTLYACAAGMLAGDVDKIEQMFTAMDWLENELVSRTYPYFGGNSLGMVDLMIWPFLERTAIFLSPVPVPQDRFPKLVAWMDRMNEEPVIRKVCLKPEFLKQFAAGFLNKQPDYDIGI